MQACGTPGNIFRPKDKTGPKTKKAMHRCDRETIKGLQQSFQFERFCGAEL
jgi:hypothetical protein